MLLLGATMECKQCCDVDTTCASGTPSTLVADWSIWDDSGCTTLHDSGTDNLTFGATNPSQGACLNKEADWATACLTITAYTDDLGRTYDRLVVILCCESGGWILEMTATDDDSCDFSAANLDGTSWTEGVDLTVNSEDPLDLDGGCKAASTSSKFFKCAITE